MWKEKVQISYLGIRITAYIIFVEGFQKDFKLTIWEILLILFRVSLVVISGKESFCQGDLV